MLTDQIGTVRDLATNAGMISDHLEYDSYGRPGSTSSSRYGFSGREFDDDVKMQYSRSRYYNPDDGVFLSEDAMRPSFANVNSRRYVNNSPIDHLDAYGFAPGPATPIASPTPTNFDSGEWSTAVGQFAGNFVGDAGRDFAFDAIGFVPEVRGAFIGIEFAKGLYDLYRKVQAQNGEHTDSFDRDPFGQGEDYIPLIDRPLPTESNEEFLQRMNAINDIMKKALEDPAGYNESLKHLDDIYRRQCPARR